MKIDTIFELKLFAFHYQNEEYNEYDRILNLWNDPEYLYSFLKENETDIVDISIESLSTQILYDANDIERTLYNIQADENKSLNEFFKQLQNTEYQAQTLSLRKGRKNYLRIYALKIDDNCFVITGGAIKLTQFMDQSTHTQTELQKMRTCKQFLQQQGALDTDSFFEFLIEGI